MAKDYGEFKIDPPSREPWFVLNEEDQLRLKHFRTLARKGEMSQDDLELVSLEILSASHSPLPRVPRRQVVSLCYAPDEREVGTRLPKTACRQGTHEPDHTADVLGTY